MSLWEKIKFSLGLASKQTGKSLYGRTFKQITGMTPESFEAIKDTTKGSIKVAKKSLTFLEWINENWQIAIIGIVAILILLKD